MKKKAYEKPAMNVVLLQHRTQLLAGSLRSVGTTGLDDDLDYDQNGGDQGYAW